MYVIPAEAGIQEKGGTNKRNWAKNAIIIWIPASARMTQGSADDIEERGDDTYSR